ncbi:hypothetical protein ACMXYR_14935 [Neptuniibacter sp. QD29_5]|uniref:hypothetical protein n=1 Tax=Neptuniibacter sp. QD29_5 TaxID=3398207 RepID=UPI0039F4798F
MDEINKLALRLKGLDIPKMPEPLKIPDIKPIDRRSRAEIREDFEKELSKIDKKHIDDLISFFHGVEERGPDESVEEQFLKESESIKNTLIKFSRTIEDFNHLNSEQERKLSLKEQELSLEASHDWREKFRLFFFRVLASGLLVVTLFAIGYIEHEYDWAHLPMSKYLSVNPSKP